MTKTCRQLRQLGNIEAFSRKSLTCRSFPEKRAQPGCNSPRTHALTLRLNRRQSNSRRNNIQICCGLRNPSPSFCDLSDDILATFSDSQGRPVIPAKSSEKTFRLYHSFVGGQSGPLDSGFEQKDQLAFLCQLIGMARCEVKNECKAYKEGIYPPQNFNKAHLFAYLLWYSVRPNASLRQFRRRPNFLELSLKATPW